MEDETEKLKAQIELLKQEVRDLDMHRNALWRIIGAICALTGIDTEYSDKPGGLFDTIRREAFDRVKGK